MLGAINFRRWRAGDLQVRTVDFRAALKARVRYDFPPPYAIDFRMSAEGDDKYIPPQAADA